MLLIFVVGDMVGGGIYALVGEVGDRVGGALWTGFVVALLLALLSRAFGGDYLSESWICPRCWSGSWWWSRSRS